MASSLLVALAVLTSLVWLAGYTVWLVRRQQRNHKGAVAAVIWVAGLAPLSTALIPRTAAGIGLSDEPGLPNTFVWVDRAALALFVVTLASAYLAIFSTEPQRAPRRGRWLFLTTIGLSVAYLLAGAFGTAPSLDWRMIAWPATTTALYLLDRTDIGWVANQAHRVLMVFVVGSLAAWIVAPTWATLTYGETLSFTDRTLRLQGLSAHPNALAQIALFALLLGFWRTAAPFRRVGCAAALFVLVLTGSRTPLLVLPVCLAIIWYFRPSDQKLVSTSLRRLGVLMMLTGAAVAAIAYLTSIGIPDTGYTQGLSTGTGRTDVWDLTLREWHSSPLVGYGPSLWSPGYRSSHGFSALSWVGQAHNQFVEALGQTGLIGFIALVLFVSAAFAVGWKGRRIDHGLTLTLTVAMIALMMAEDPLDVGSAPITLMPALLVFLLALNLLRHPRWSQLATPPLTRTLIRVA
jgi:exopolysaccharide production protein ExoQ